MLEVVLILAEFDELFF